MHSKLTIFGFVCGIVKACFLKRNSHFVNDRRPLLVTLAYKVEFVSNFQYDGLNNESPIKSTNVIFMSLSRIPIIDYSIIH